MNYISIKNDNSIKGDDILFHVKIEKITPPSKGIPEALYHLCIINSNDQKWYKECTLKELYLFRNNIIFYFPSVCNLPFPLKSFWSYLPLIGHKYDERNWDVLLENKFILDDFFKSICNDKELYKLTSFIKFFEAPHQRETFSSFNVI